MRIITLSKKKQFRVEKMLHCSNTIIHVVLQLSDMVILYMSVVVFGCAYNTSSTGLAVCVRAHHQHSYSFQHTRFIGQIRKCVCVCVRLLLMPVCKMGLRSIHSELIIIDENEIIKSQTETVGLQTSCNVQYLVVLCYEVNSPPPSCVSSNHSPPLYPVSRDLNLFALNSTVYTTNSKAYHFLLLVPHMPSVPVSPLPPLCVRVCEHVCAHASAHMLVNLCVCD